ncbi:MAG: hypothetical protein AABZ30_02065 [Myxococcota bacterium]
MLVVLLVAQIVSASPPEVSAATAPAPAAQGARTVQAPAPPPEGAAPPAPASPAPRVAPVPAPSSGAHAYYGYHPVSDGYGTFCVTPGPHVHPFAPFDPYLFVWWNGAWTFVGDPYDFGYGGGAHLFWRHHPHPWGGWCYFEADHYHLYGPWGPYFRPYGAYFVFVGGFGSDYYRHQQRHATYYRTVYAPRYRHAAGRPWAARRAAQAPPPTVRRDHGVHVAPPAPGTPSRRRHPPASERATKSKRRY